MLKIGNVNVAVPVALAPMAGVTDLPYRLICKEFGCGLTCTELISAKAIKYNNRNTDILLRTDSREAPAMIQLFGSDPEIMAEIAKRVEELTFDIIDINMGCPVPKVVNNGEGSALMRTPKLAGEIIEKMVRAVKKPVTVKIRSGFSAKEVNAVEVARIAQESGAAAVTVHARTREQYYSGEADWSVIAAVKAAVSIPVIGNGDIKDGEDAISMMKETGCDGVMIGRAARGNPWIFAEVAEAIRREDSSSRCVRNTPQNDTPTAVQSLRTSRSECEESPESDTPTGVLSFRTSRSECEESPQNDIREVGDVSSRMGNISYKSTLEDKKCMLIRHLQDLCEFKGEYTAVREMRKHFGWYMAGVHGASALRRRINEAQSLDEFVAIVREC